MDATDFGGELPSEFIFDTQALPPASEDPDLIITITSAWRRVIGARDGWVCGICRDPERAVDQHRKCPDPLAAVVDHIIPRNHGGLNKLGNLQIAHCRCNALKNDSFAIAPQYARAVLARTVDGKPVPARIWLRYGGAPLPGSRAWPFRHYWLARHCDRGEVAVEPWRLILRYRVRRARHRQAQRREYQEQTKTSRGEGESDVAVATGSGGRSAKIRAWAASQGYEVGNGRIPAEVIQEYQKSHPLA